MDVETRVDHKRGCGWRKAGGLYLVSGNLAEPCPLLPYETKVCPTCGEGIRPARGFTWVDGGRFIPPTIHGTFEHWARCPLAPAGGSGPPDGGPAVSRLGRCGLIWVGEQHYPTPRAFMREAAEQGVSRRITAVPKDFEVGETWVLFGHRKAIERACTGCGDEPGGDPDCPICQGTGYEHVPGVVTAFRPTAIEYVVKGDETDADLEALEARGITPVQVKRAIPQGALE